MLVSAKKENKTGKLDQDFWGRDFLLLSKMVLKGHAVQVTTKERQEGEGVSSEVVKGNSIAGSGNSLCKGSGALTLSPVPCPLTHQYFSLKQHFQTGSVFVC